MKELLMSIKGKIQRLFYKSLIGIHTAYINGIMSNNYTQAAPIIEHRVSPVISWITHCSQNYLVYIREGILSFQHKTLSEFYTSTSGSSVNYAYEAFLVFGHTFYYDKEYFTFKFVSLEVSNGKLKAKVYYKSETRILETYNNIANWVDSLPEVEVNRMCFMFKRQGGLLISIENN